jgi:hypothetical protein
VSAAADRCSDTARERADPMVATAAPTRRWLLLEHPGPWAAGALDSPGLAPAREALQQAITPGVSRVLLIRRPGRQTAGGRRVWMVLDHDVGWVAAGTWEPDPTPQSLEHPDAGLLAAADALARAPSTARVVDAPTGPVLLVCAHGRHDVCCAVRGRPVAAALAQRWPDQTWECSHVGGDRFAANLVVVPDGVYYGQLDAVSAVEVVEAHLAGRIDAERLRGFTWQPPAAQAAMAQAHRRWGPAGPHAFTLTSLAQAADHRWRVELAGAAGLPSRVVATVTRSLRPPARLTCRGTTDAVAAVFDVTDLEVLDA